MAQHSKAYRQVAEKIDKDNLYTPLQATTLAKESGSKNYDSTVDVSVRLGVDPRKADQMVRGTVALPSGTGKDVRVAVFAAGEAAAAARGPVAKTMTRATLPVPWGRLTVPRTIWSALRGSTPSRKATSTVASYLATEVSLARRTAESGL